jgi:hypothetical protein
MKRPARRLPMRSTVDPFDSAHMPAADITEQLHELRREMNARRAIYPALLRTGRLTEHASTLQAHRLAAAIATLEQARDAERDLAAIVAGDGRKAAGDPAPDLAADPRAARRKRDPATAR